MKMEGISYLCTQRERKISSTLKAMVRFRGNALGKVDDKGRIVFPAVFRDVFARAGEEDMTLVFKKSV